MPKSKPVAVLGLTLLLAAASPDCPRWYYVHYGFDLAQPLPAGYVLPDSANDGTHLLTRADRGRYPACADLGVYDVIDLHRGFGENAVYVGIDRGAPAAVSVLVHYDPETGQEPVDWGVEVARLALFGANIEPSIAASTKENIGEKMALTEWCGHRGQSR